MDPNLNRDLLIWGVVIALVFLGYSRQRAGR